MNEIRNTTGYFANLDGSLFSAETPRCGTSEGGWPLVELSDGTKVKLAFRCFTADERTEYYRRTGKGRFASEKKPASTKSDELRNALLAIKSVCNEQIKDKKVVTELNTLIENILPPDPRISKFEKMLDGLSPEELAMLKAKLAD